MTPPTKRGGARQGAGAKAADGATGTYRVNVSIDAECDAIARRAGANDRSLGIREALRYWALNAGSRTQHCDTQLAKKEAAR